VVLYDHTGRTRWVLIKNKKLYPRIFAPEGARLLGDVLEMWGSVNRDGCPDGHPKTESFRVPIIILKEELASQLLQFSRIVDYSQGFFTVQPLRIKNTQCDGFLAWSTKVLQVNLENLLRNIPFLEDRLALQDLKLDGRVCTRPNFACDGEERALPNNVAEAVLVREGDLQSRRKFERRQN
jgi:hypothetical protein